MVPVAVQGVEGVEKLLLGALASGDELHVVEDQRVDATEFIAELAGLVAPDRVDELVHEDLGRHEEDLLRAVSLHPNLMANRAHQVGLAQADTAIDEKRVVLLARLIGDRTGRGMSELIARADHELRERITRV